VFDSREEKEICFFSITSRPALGSTQPPIQWIPEAVSSGVKRQGREADHTPPSGAEVKNVELYLHSPVCLHNIYIYIFLLLHLGA
jgi:hypothetical protein